jgi:thermitase
MENTVHSPSETKTDQSPPEQNVVPLNVKLLGLGAALAILFIGIFIASVSTRSSSQKQPTPTPHQVTNLVPKPSHRPSRVEGQIIVKFKDGITSGQINSDLELYQAKIIRQIPALRRTVIQVPAGQEDIILQKLSQDKLIEQAEPNHTMYADFKPNDPLYAQQWGLSNTGQSIGNSKGQAGDDIRVEQAWNVTRGNGVKVAVIDSGIDLNHPDLAGKVIAQNVYATNTIDDQFGHGTHVAGGIVANGNNGQGISGVCPDCKLIIAKALDQQGMGDEAAVAEAITWATDQGAKVINISAGGDTLTSTMQDALTYANSKGSIVVCSAGNDGNSVQTFPAGSDLVVSVAATDNKDKLANFSTYGSWVKVAAPGVDIMSTLPTHAFNLQKESPLATTNDYLSGTSMAAPIVSGTLALIWASPYGTSNTAVINRLYQTADKISGTGTSWKYGRINVSKAVGADNTPTPTNPAPTQTPEPSFAPTESIETPTPTPPSPTFTCLGACVTPSTTEIPTLVIPTAIPQHPTPQTINSSIDLSSIFQLITQPSQNPCTHHHHHYHHKCRDDSRGTQDGLLAILLQLLQQLFTLFGGGITPPPPGPAPTATLPTSVISPTCVPRPACLDATPACNVPESINECPPSPKPSNQNLGCNEFNRTCPAGYTCVIPSPNPLSGINAPGVCTPTNPAPTNSNTCAPVASCANNAACPAGTVCSQVPVFGCFPVGCSFPICLAKNTLIDTPHGQIKVQTITEGDSIWTLTKDGHKVASRVLKISHTKVPPTHKVVHLVFSNGKELFVSRGHPTADGRTVEKLVVGDIVSGLTVVKTEVIPYSYEYTYDLLPAGETGFYFANGVRMGSTLH